GPPTSTAADGVRRMNDATSGSPNRSMVSWSMTVELAAVLLLFCGTREAVTTMSVADGGTSADASAADETSSSATIMGTPVEKTTRHVASEVPNGPTTRGWSRPGNGRRTRAGS